MKKGAGVCSLNRVLWCWGISKEKPFVFYSENELFFKKGRKKRLCLSLRRNEHVLSWVRHLDSKEWMLDLCLELFGWKKILFIDLNQTRALHIWVQNQVLKNLIVGTATLAEAAVLQKVNMHSIWQRRLNFSRFSTLYF